MRLAPAIALLLLTLVLSTSATASNRSVLKTKWSYSAHATPMVADTHTGILVLLGGSDSIMPGVLSAVRANNSMGVWHVAPPAGMNVSGVELNEEHQLVVVTFKSGAWPHAGQLKVYKLSDGSPVFSLDMARYEAAKVGKDSIVITTSYPEVGDTNVIAAGLLGMKLRSYKLQSGHLKFNTTTPRIISSLKVAIGETVIAVLAGPPQGGTVGVWIFSKSTGEYLCNFPVVPNWVSCMKSGIPMAGDVISIGNGVLSNASTCSNLKVAFSGVTSLHGDSIYSWDAATKKLSQYNDKGSRVWSTTLHAADVLPGKFFAVTSVAFNQDAVVVNNRGTFTAVNKTSGVVLWNTSLVVPFGPSKSSGQQVHPLGHHKLLIPNLQGYVILDTQHGGRVESVEEMEPITAVFSFAGRTKEGAEKPFVVFGDLATGALKAVELA